VLNLKRRIVLEARRVWKVYGTKVQVKALQGIDLPISEGEFIAIIGPSGSGKSTLMHILGCLELPTQGEVAIEDIDVAELSQAELAEIRGKKIGFVFQQFNLLPRTTAQKNVELPLVFQGIGRRERHKRAAEVLEKVGLGDRLNSQLSGGEQQRVAIARALVSNPTIIFADEPTGNLDTKSSMEIMAILRKLNDEGKTLVVVTHDSDIANWADRIVCLQDGRIMENET